MDIDIASAYYDTNTFAFQVQTAAFDASKAEAACWFDDDFHCLGVKLHAFDELFIGYCEYVFHIFLNQVESHVGDGLGLSTICNCHGLFDLHDFAKFQG